MGVNSLPKTVTRQRRGCDLNPGPSAPESSTLTTRLPSLLYTQSRTEVQLMFCSNHIQLLGISWYEMMKYFSGPVGYVKLMNHIQIPKRTILKTGTLKSLWQSITNTAINTQKARRERKREDARDTHLGTKDRETNKRSFAATYFAVHLLSGFVVLRRLLCRINSSRRSRSISRNALFDALHQLSGTHYRKLFLVVTLLQFLSLGLRHSSSLRLPLLSLLTNTLPGPSASEVTTLRRYTNLYYYYY